jgi:hypothetical protein
MATHGMPLGTLVHCIYASAATRDLDEAELVALLNHARAANARRGVTGMLVYSDGSFFQVIEGAQEVVEALLDRIALDPRHERLTRIIHEPIARRTFGEWTMGYARMTADDLRAVDGLNDFFERATCLAQIDGGRARKLLHGFAQGRWRTRRPSQAPRGAALTGAGG